jgi:hypothetical protein
MLPQAAHPPLPTQEHLLKRVVLRAVTSPGSLFLASTGVLLAFSPDTWHVGAGFLMAELGWLWWRIRDPRHARLSSEEMLRRRWHAQINRLEELSGTLDRDTAGTLSQIVESQERLLGVYNHEAPVLPHSRVELTSLLERCVSLAEKRRQLQQFLATTRCGEIQRQIYQLQLRVEQSHDVVTRELFSQAIEQKRQELENYSRLQEAISRIDGQLAAVQCTFDNMIGKVVRLRSAEAVVGEMAPDPIFTELRRLSSGVEALEDSLEEILVTGSAR